MACPEPLVCPGRMALLALLVPRDCEESLVSLATMELQGLAALQEPTDWWDCLVREALKAFLATMVLKAPAGLLVRLRWLP